MTSWTRAAALLTAAAALTACSSSEGSDGSASASDGPLQVSVGFYPYEFVTARVGGPDVEVTNLTQPGTEPHDLELTPQQVAGLSETDLVVYSPRFQPAVDEAVEQQAEGRTLDVLSAVELRDPPAVEGEQEAEEEEAPGGKDPHVWLDPVRLGQIAQAVAERLGQERPDRAAAFAERATALQAELKTLDDEMRAGLSRCERTEIVTSHDAYGYLAGAYGLTQVPIAGLSPEDEASAGRLAEIAVLAEQKGVTTIFFEELVSPAVAESLAREIGARATVLSPLEGPPEDGDYLSAMRENLTTLQSALGCS